MSLHISLGPLFTTRCMRMSACYLATKVDSQNIQICFSASAARKWLSRGAHFMHARAKGVGLQRCDGANAPWGRKFSHSAHTCANNEQSHQTSLFGYRSYRTQTYDVQNDTCPLTNVAPPLWVASAVSDSIIIKSNPPASYMPQDKAISL